MCGRAATDEGSRLKYSLRNNCTQVNYIANVAINVFIAQQLKS